MLRRRPIADSLCRRIVRLQRQACRGASLVEFSLTVPILFLFVFAALEFSRLNMIRHTAEAAAYEGARRGMLHGASASQVQQTVSSQLQPIAIRNATIGVVPAQILPDSPTITVTVDVPFRDNCWIAPFFFTAPKVSAFCTLTREVAN